ncbi:GNAT family N-acetyltransferase [Methanosarcina sp.]|uniref:GNAT family N-acetyltransferase n=1 Tax=Methanosarcina sp. TaxID=2213 RepID=UPI002ABA879D|nr:GNAT family N-acetyltransferase [Methanosarcina sp.]MDY9924855.1 GNAT family N-acetyltransferase [Methanosarcina sp.]
METAKPEDIETLERLIYETIDAYYSDIYPCEAVDYFKEYQNTENILNDVLKEYCLILTCGKEIIGTGTLLDSNARRVFIKLLYQKVGLGKRVMHGLEDKAVEEGVRMLDLGSSLVSYPFYGSWVSNKV